MKQIFKWSILFGLAGLALTAPLYFAWQSELLTIDHAFLLWPTVMVLTADPVTAVEEILAWGGQFVIWALLGAVVGFVAYLRRRRSDAADESWMKLH